MAGEIHYAVCMRCGMILRNSTQSLARHRIVRGAIGNLVIRANYRPGCSVCGRTEVEVRWGVPPSLTLAGNRRVAALAARRTLE